jgi:putative membrane protein insertion efficiency factor
MNLTAGRAARKAGRLPSLALIGLFRLYQLALSPMTGASCRYYPSCSAYAIGALRSHGLVRGAGLTAWRLLRCNPWSKGGVDHVPPRGAEGRCAA